MERYRISGRGKIRLRDFDPNDARGDKEKGKERLLQLNRELEVLQEMLYAEHRHKVLIVLQAMDTGGKDGVIRHVFEGVNPQGVRVASFKKPSAVELDHDYLWRAHQVVPACGEMVIFNRSYYEDVLVVRVHELVPKEIWARRYEQINDFERMLVEEGTLVLKFFLHIDADEQKQRLQARLDDPAKQWKFNPADLEERGRWPEYVKAYEAVLNKTSTAWAPWYVVPANKKWYRNLVIAAVIVGALKKLDMQYPPLEYDPASVVIDS